MFPFLLLANQGPRVVAVTSGEGNGNSTPTLDVSGIDLRENDVLVVFFAMSETADVSFNMTGFTQVADLYVNDNYDTDLHVGYKVQTSTPDTSVVVGPNTGDSSDAWSAIAFNARGVDTSTPLDVSATTTTQNNTLLIDPPSISPTQSALVIAGGASSSNNGANDSNYSSSDLELTNRGGVPGAGIDAIFLAAGWAKVGSGSFNPAQFTSGYSDRADTGYCACTLALRPA